MTRIQDQLIGIMYAYHIARAHEMHSLSGISIRTGIINTLDIISNLIKNNFIVFKVALKTINLEPPIIFLDNFANI